MSETDEKLKTKPGRAVEVTAQSSAAPEITQSDRVRDICQQYESVASAEADCFTLIDAEYRYREANEAYCRSHGLTREDIVDRKVAELWGEEVFEAVIAQPLKQCFGGQEIHYQARFEFPRTGLRYFDVSFFPYSEDGSVSHVIVVTRDITNSRRAEEEVGLLLNLIRAVNESQDFDSALQVSLQTICVATDWVFGQAWIPSADGAFLQCSSAWFRTIAGLEDLRAMALRSRWRPGEGLPGRAWTSRKPCWVAESSEDPPFPAGYRKAHADIKAVTAIPVIAGDFVVAVMEFCVLEPQVEDERLMGVVSAVATQLGTLFGRKRSEEALRESEERYRTLVESAQDVIFGLTADGKITTLNRAFEAITGWPSREWIGKDFVPLLHPEDALQALDRFQAILRGESATVHRTYRVRKKSGSYSVGEFTMNGEIKNGKVVGVFGIARDVTERQGAEEALRDSEERYRRIVETAEEGIWVLDADHRTVFVNRKLAEMLGYTVKEMMGQPLSEFLALEDRAAWQAKAEREPFGGRQQHDFRFLRKGGSEVWALLAKSPILDREGRYAGALAMVSDITERKRAEAALRQSEEHYRELFHQAYRMQENLRHLSNKILEVQEEERTRISRELHDEVGQALTAVTMNLAVLKKDIAPENQRSLQRIGDSQSLLVQTMEAVHEFARELRPAMLDHLGLLAALRSYIKTFEERTGIHVHFRAPAPAVVESVEIGLKTAIYRIAQESLNNIAKHAQASQVSFVIRKLQQRICVEIMDNGKGFKLDARAPGNAPKRLGLLGMQERVRLINGEFAVESEPGKGTLVRVQVPLKAERRAGEIGTSAEEGAAGWPRDASTST